MATTVPVSHASLLTDCQIVTLATNGEGDYPQVSAVWFAVDDDGTIAVSLNTSRQKTKNLRAHPRATLFFVDPANPYRTLEVRADVDVRDDTDLAGVQKIQAKYGADVRDNDRPGETRVWVRFTPVKVNTFG